MSPSILFDTISFNSNGNYEGFLAKVNGGISSVENNYEKLKLCIQTQVLADLKFRRL